MRIETATFGFLLCLPLPAFCGESNPYKLHLQNAADYRLHSSNDTRYFPPTPAALADRPYAAEIEAAARANQLDPVLVHALIHVESDYRADAVSDKGALGLMQLLPETAQRFGVKNPLQARANIKAGTRYLRVLLDRYNQRIDLAIMAYNAGEGAVDRYGGMPPYAETQRYVPAVLNTYSSWRMR